MQDDPLRQEIEIELRALRTQARPLALEHVALSPTLTDFVGRGSTDRAYGIVMDAREQHGGDPASDIRAFFGTCGLGLPGDTLAQRLEAYAEEHFVDPRTALRRSDRGARKLSYILRDALNYERPFGKLIVSEVKGLVTLGVIIDVPNRSQWRRPVIWINGNQESREFELHDSTTNNFFLTAKERFDSTPISTAEAEGDDVFDARVLWSMPVWPTWMVGSSLTTPGLSSRFDLERQSGVSIHLWR